MEMHALRIGDGTGVETGPVSGSSGDRKAINVRYAARPVSKEYAYLFLISDVFCTGNGTDCLDAAELIRRSGLLEELDTRVKKSLEFLNEKDAQCLSLRYGFDGYPRTLEEVAQEMGRTRERARQRIGKSLRFLRHPHQSRRLRPFVPCLEGKRILEHPYSFLHQIQETMRKVDSNDGK